MLYDEHQDHVAPVWFSRPESEETCALTLQSLQEDSIDVLPGCTFFPHLPQLTKVTLSCGHTFGAMSLIYYWLRSCMRCPVCRRGNDTRLCVSNLHPSYRTTMTEHILQIDRVAEEEAEEQARQDIDELTMSEFADMIADPTLIIQHLDDFPVAMSIYFYSKNGRRHVQSLEMPMRFAMDSMIETDRNVSPAPVSSVKRLFTNSKK